ncbi:hypothetical protein DFH28DRAFT_962318 [Melampsora americana]|nr:hypothetical protein DFH28DRAFT_962318 [Melampsora americana]
MVLIDGKKFACAACVKGHRSSSCAHTDRTLVEIGKKGRPPTQCAHCRELRRISKVHSKCVCGDKPSKQPRSLAILPNGLNGSLASSSTVSFDGPRSVTRPINPCSCSSGGQCCCSAPAHPSTGTRAAQRRSKQKTPPSAHQPVLPQRVHSPPINQSEAVHSNPLSSSSASPPSRPSCCGAKRVPPSDPHPSSRSSQPNGFHPYPSRSAHSSPVLNTAFPFSANEPIPSTSASNLTSNHISMDSSTEKNVESEALFAPQTAGTALCFCGIHCPCPGCVLHDPLGLKFLNNSSNLSPACPTSMKRAEGCLAGLDLPTINELLNLNPISSPFPPMSPVQLPSMSQTLGFNPTSNHHSNPTGGCCGGGGGSGGTGPVNRNSSNSGVTGHDELGIGLSIPS